MSPPPDLDDDCTAIRPDPFRALTFKILAAGAVPLIGAAIAIYVQSSLHAAEIDRIQVDIAEHAAAPVHQEAERGLAQLRGEISGLRADLQANERVNQAKLESIAERLGRIESSVTRRRRTSGD
jgi:hypothetical protein